MIKKPALSRVFLCLKLQFALVPRARNDFVLNPDSVLRDSFEKTESTLRGDSAFARRRASASPVARF